MFDNFLQDIRDKLLRSPNTGGIFGDHGYIITRGVDNAFKGITDDIGNYFYIDYSRGVSQVELDKADDLGVKGAYWVSGNFKLVAKFCDVDTEAAMRVLFNLLASMPEVSVGSLSKDEAAIYKEEAGELLTCDMQLVRVSFTITLCEFSNKCTDIICKLDAC